MIEEKQRKNEILSEGGSSEKIEMGLDLDSMRNIMQILSKDLYSDAIGSAVRETVSNALDSHRRVGQINPVIVSLIPDQSYNYHFIVEDFGTGLDDTEVRDVLSKYGKSTKREIADEFGMFGLGFKSPLAYTSSFNFIARKDGVERHYIMYEADETNMIELLSELPTSERNGMKVIIPVNSADLYSFVEKIKEQLSYFENVYFNVVIGGQVKIPQFHIYRNEHFQKSELSEDTYLHICLEDVYYPINFKELGIDPIKIPVGLRFSLTDGVYPTPNRENIRYTKETKENILKRITDFASYLVDLYNKERHETLDIRKALNFYKNSPKMVSVTIGEKTFDIDVSSITNISEIPIAEPTIPGVNLISLKTLSSEGKLKSFTSEYKVIAELTRGTIRKPKSWDDNVSIIYDPSEYAIIGEKPFGTIKKEYVKFLFSGRKRFIQKTYHRTLYRGSSRAASYFAVLDLHLHPRQEWRERILEYQYIQSLYLKDVTNLDDIEPSAEWLEARRKARLLARGYDDSDGVTERERRRKPQGSFICKKAEPLERTTGGWCKFVPITYMLEGFHKLSSLYVYGTHDDQKRLGLLFHVFPSSKVKFLSVSPREFKALEKIKIHNLITLERFMKGDLKPFRRLVTATLIEKLRDEYPHAFHSASVLSKISKSIGDKIFLLENYRREHFTRRNSDDYKIILDVAEAYNLFDESVYPTYKEMVEFFEKYPFVNTLSRYMSSYSDDDPVRDVMIQMFKFSKIRMNPEMYEAPKEEVKEETNEESEAEDVPEQEEEEVANENFIDVLTT